LTARRFVVSLLALIVAHMCRWIEKPVSFHKNWRNWSGSVSPVFNKPVSKSIFLKNIFLKKWFTGFGGFQLLSVDRFTSFSTGLSVIPTGLLILDFSNAKFKFRAVFDRFSW
jgi:hypothetical protein